MHLSIDITPETQARIAAAAQRSGEDISAVIEKLAKELPPVSPENAPIDEKNAAAIALLRSWREDDATDDDAELDRRDIDTEQLLNNLQSDRTEFRLPEL